MRAGPGAHGALAVDPHGAEAEHHVAAGSGASKAEHGAEAGEEQHLIKLVAQIDAVRAGEDLIVDHLALGVHGYVEEQAMRKRKLGVVLFGGPSLRVVRK